MLFRCLVALFLLAQLPAGYTQNVVTVSNDFQESSTTNFLKLVSLAGLTETLATSNSVTLFVPTDEGLLSYPSLFLHNLEKPEFLPILRQIIAYHVVPGRYLLANFRDGELTTESNFRKIKVTSATSTYLPFVNDVQIMAGDMKASNGVVHLINRLLVPADLAPSGILALLQDSGIYTNTKTFFAAAGAAGLLPSIQTGAQKTLFVPTDAAFAKLPKGMLANLLMPKNKQHLAFLVNNHIVPGMAFAWTPNTQLRTAAGRILMITDTGLNNTFPDGSNGNPFNVTNTNLFALNGVVHLLDDVLIPPESVPTDIPNTLPTIPGLKTFFSALTATGNLPIVLKNAAAYTVFAPSDAAFAKLPAGYLSGLLVNNVVTLRNLMSAHLVRSSFILNSELKDGMILNTDAPGVTITVSQLANGDFLLNGKVKLQTISMGPLIIGDVVTTNGVIHVIDTVLIPPALVPIDTISLLQRNSSIFSTFSSLVAQTSLKYGPIFSDRLFPHTLFAPTNAAFAQLPKGFLGWIQRPTNKDKLDSIVLYHFVRGIYFTNNLGNQTLVSVGNRAKFSVLRTVGNGILPKIELNPYNELTFNSAILDDLHADMVAANGLVHPISKVICPPSASPVNLNSLLLSVGLTDFAKAIVGATNFTDFTKPGRNQFIIFAPRNGLLTDDSPDFGNLDDYIFAGASLLSEFNSQTTVLNMVSTRSVNVTFVGGQSFFNGIRILNQDLPATNGLINILDGRL